MKIIAQLIVAFFISLLICNIGTYRPSTSTLNVLYTVAGILFSVGLGLIITIVPSGVKNPSYIAEIRGAINKVRNRFFIEFFLITLAYISFSEPKNWEVIKIVLYEEIALKIDLVLYTEIFLILSLPYFMYNFLSIQKLNNDIFDKVNQENKNKPNQ
ncbi:hypothetical protein [Pasteurella oralis]|uniref:hypothetical protein n=1 Tax=Pasteurella oralis TaxID=1071947 RepID=UPI000C7B8F1D|nr:hypothetical protein [Pasteurella oralis]